MYFVAILLLIIAALSSSYYFKQNYQLNRVVNNNIRLHSADPQRFNTKIDLDSEKVVNNMNLKAGEKAVVCRCWKSEKFPLCDGSHMAHNKETGDNIGPAIVSVAKE